MCRHVLAVSLHVRNGYVVAKCGVCDLMMEKAMIVRAVMSGGLGGRALHAVVGFIARNSKSKNELNEFFCFSYLWETRL